MTARIHPSNASASPDTTHDDDDPGRDAGDSMLEALATVGRATRRENGRDSDLLVAYATRGDRWVRVLATAMRATPPGPPTGPKRVRAAGGHGDGGPSFGIAAPPHRTRAR